MSQEDLVFGCALGLPSTPHVLSNLRRRLLVFHIFLLLLLDLLFYLGAHELNR